MDVVQRFLILLLLCGIDVPAERNENIIFVSHVLLLSIAIQVGPCTRALRPSVKNACAVLHPAIREPGRKGPCCWGRADKI